MKPFERQPHEMVKYTQTIRRQKPTNCLSVFDHFVGLALKELKLSLDITNKNTFASQVNINCRKIPLEESCYAIFYRFIPNSLLRLRLIIKISTGNHFHWGRFSSEKELSQRGRRY